MKKSLSHETIGLFTLIMLSSALVTSVRNLPSIAESGLTMIFFALIAVVCFFMPIALSSAELATGWPKLGGIYVWIREAFGVKWGFFGIWLQWIHMITSVISMLYFIGGSLAYVFAPELASNRLFLAVVELIIIWGATFLNLKGLRITGLMSTIGFMGGVLFPGILIIILGIVYLLMGNPIQMNLDLNLANIFPDFQHLSTLVLLVAFMRAFAGIEASAAHANSVLNPKKNYPIAILIVALIGLVINLFGSLSVAIVVPQKEISLLSGLMTAFTSFFERFNMLFMVPVLGFLVALGQTAGVTSWFAGPVKGLLSAAKDGDLPPVFQKTNEHGMPRNLMIVQGSIISIFSTGLLFLPSLNIAFWISVALTMMVYTLDYFLMLLSALVLRYKHPNVVRAYKIPFGKGGIWTITFLGMGTNLFAFFVLLFPPAQMPTEHTVAYMSFLITMITIFVSLPFVIQGCKKASWKVLAKEEKIQ